MDDLSSVIGGHFTTGAPLELPKSQLQLITDVEKLIRGMTVKPTRRC